MIKNKLHRCRLILVAIFSFILGCMITINLTPVDKTCQIDSTDREYNIMNNGKLKNPELIILILSSPINYSRRSTIRETWLKLKDRSHIKDGDRNKFDNLKHYFVVGSLGLKSEHIRNINNEQLKHNDILILPMFDSYNNLTYKVLKSFEWLNEQHDFGFPFKYVLKCDDDSFVRIDNLVHELSQIELMYIKSDTVETSDSSPYFRVNYQSNGMKGSPELYWGYFNGNAKIKTAGKWKETNWILCDNYLPYALGGGYILSKNLVTYLGQNANYLRLYHSEDVSVGVWLSAVNSVLRIHDRRFDTEWSTRGCQNDYLITHSVTEKVMRAMYESIINTNSICSSEEVKRMYYLYNWTTVPSKCCNKNS